MSKKQNDYALIDPESRASSKRIMLSERNVRIIDARRSGATLSELAEAHGVSIPAISQLILRMLRRNEFSEVEHYRLDQVDKLNSLWATFYPKAIEGDERALASCLKISKEISKITGAYVNFSVSMNYVKSESRVEIIPIENNLKGRDYRASIDLLHSPEWIEGQLGAGGDVTMITDGQTVDEPKADEQ